MSKKTRTSCPLCESPVRLNERVCRSCGVDLAMAAAVTERVLLDHRPDREAMSVSPEVLVPRLGERLVEQGVLSAQELEKALAYQAEQREGFARGPYGAVDLFRPGERHPGRHLTGRRVEDVAEAARNPLDPFAADEMLLERKDNLRGRLRSLHTTKGVKLELCDITRTQVNKPKDIFYKMVGFVRSGVVRIAELQSKGFAYIKVE